MGDEPEKSPVLHLNFGKERNRVVDQVVRKMEDASAARAEDAAEQIGASTAEMSAIKITNLKDDTKPGEIAAFTVPENRVAANAERASANLGYQLPTGQRIAPNYQGSATSQFGDQTREGPNPLATRKVMDSMPHANIIATATAQGSDGKRH